MDSGYAPDLLLDAYAAGVFPMAESRDAKGVFWMDPHQRGIFELDRFHISRSLARLIRRETLEIRLDSRFGDVVAACAERPETWISHRLEALYRAVHRAGHAHSVEVWENGALVGGVFGIALGGAFFGESMFSRRPNASKVALAYLVDRLREGGFTLFDTQFLTPHLASLGAVEIPRAEYRRRLTRALEQPADFHRQGAVPRGQSVLQRNTQTSWRA